MIDSSFPLVPVSRFDDNPASHDPAVEPFELFGALTDLTLDRIGSVHAAKGDLKRQLHVPPPSCISPALNLGAAAPNPESSSLQVAALT
jgi:hypothetical protein